MSIKTIEVKGRKFEVNLDSRDRFWVNLDGTIIDHESLAGLREKLSRAMTRKGIKVNIPFVRWQPGNWRQPGHIVHGVITGIHGSNRNILVKLDGGKTEQEYSYSRADGGYVKPEVEAELEKLSRAKDEAEAALDKFTKANHIDPNKAVREELAKMGMDADEVLKA